MQLLCQIMQYIGTGPSNKICGRPDGTRCSRQACGIAVAFLSNPLHVSIHSHSTLLSEDAIRSTHCRDFHHRSIRRAREEQRRGDSINDVHIILGFFDSLFPLCPKNLYCFVRKIDASFGPSSVQTSYMEAPRGGGRRRRESSSKEYTESSERAKLAV